MASNEHKSLSNVNLHNPKDFSIASADTLLSKDVDGNLVWVAKSNIKTTSVNIRGFAEGGVIDTNYWFPVDMKDSKSPFEFDEDYGSGTISASNDITVSKAIRSSAYCAPQACSLNQVYGWMSGSVTETVTLALLKLSPTANDNTPFEIGGGTNTMTLLDEITVSTYGSDIKLGLINETAFTVATISQGDLIIPMIKSAGGANNIFFNLSIEFKYTS